MGMRKGLGAGVVSDILRSYRAPRAVLRHRIGPAVDEGGALITLVLACGLIFVAQWPRLSREAYEQGKDLDMMVGGALMAWVFIMPLVLYALAALLHVVLRLVGGKQSAYEVRMATFWALLAAAPLWLLYGLCVGFLGVTPAVTAVGFIGFAAYVVFWALGLIEVAFAKGQPDV
ncbi:Yip1-like protein [Pacificibacter maritimus]|uniref:Yip1-like protein n=1 Tax=Pacificibacter maritimus TaxID=762213 RepID=A0A3N4V2W3_9RHOB|nr:YIP1 family protein [Pacificibacter maritimus]RPE71437.1 Yip1-like protein [Pacificibacter maritimus]